jgi:hypothetical protein
MGIAMLALGVALGGTATAGTMGLIGSPQIKNHSIQVVDLSPAAVRALHGQRGTSGTSGYNGARGATGAQGASGAQGVAGVAGASGTFDPNKLSYIDGPDVTVLPGDVGTATASCPAGKAAISGGFFSSVARIGFSETFGSTFHGIAVYNDTPIVVTIHSTVVCAA